MGKLRALMAVASVVVLAGCWTVPGAGPERSGHNPNEYGLTSVNVASLEPDWTWQAEWTTPRTVLHPIASPAGVHISVGHKLVTLDPATGTERWRAVLFDTALAEQVPVSAGSPTAEGGNVFVPISVYRNFGPSGTHAYDAETGAYLGGVARSSSGLTVPRDGRLVGTFGEIVGTFQAITGYFVTDRGDPAKSWIAYLALGGLPPTTPSEVAVGPDSFYFKDGSTLFAYPLSKPPGCVAVSPGASFEFCPPTWSKVTGPGLTRPVLSDDGTLLFAGDAGHFMAFQASTGGDMWLGGLPGGDAPSAPPASDADQVLVPAAGELIAFKRAGCGAAACNRVWAADTGGTVAVQPAIAGGVVYTATTTGLLRAFPAAGCGAVTCPPLWEHGLATQITGAPAVSNGRLFVGTADGRLVSFAPTQ